MCLYSWYQFWLPEQLHLLTYAISLVTLEYTINNLFNVYLRLLNFTQFYTAETCLVIDEPKGRLKKKRKKKLMFSVFILSLNDGVSSVCSEPFRMEKGIGIYNVWIIAVSNLQLATHLTRICRHHNPHLPSPMVMKCRWWRKNKIAETSGWNEFPL